MTQTESILRHLQEVGPITPLEALNRYGSLRLASRILELRALGHHIESEFVSENEKTFCRYVLKPKGQLSLFETKPPVVVDSSGGLGFARADALSRTTSIAQVG